MKYYTDEEDNYIYNKAMDNIDNLSRCFASLSVKLGRSKAAIGKRYYCVLTNPEHPKYKGYSSACLSKKKILCNRKIRKDTMKNVIIVKGKASIATQVFNYIKKILRGHKG